MTLIRVDVKGEGIFDNVWQNTYHVQTATPVTQADAANVLSDIRTWIEDAYSQIQTLIAITFTASEIVLRTIDLITKVETFYTSGAWTFTGSSGAEALPAQVAASVQFPAENFRRGGQKRLAGFSEGPSNAGTWSAGTITNMINYGGVIVAGPPTVLAPAMDFVVWRRSQGIVAPHLNTAIINTIAGSMNTRKPNRGV